MFSYRPPKSSIWGHALRGRDAAAAERNALGFLDAFFEPLDPSTFRPSPSYFDCDLKWKRAVLPDPAYPEQFAPGNGARWLRTSATVNIANGSRIMFPEGLLIPVSPTEASSYKFLSRLSAAAPFRMSARNFQLLAPTAARGKYRARKPDDALLARLLQAIGS